MKKLFKFITALMLAALLFCFAGNLSLNDINEENRATVLTSAPLNERAVATQIEAIRSIKVTANNYEQSQTEFDKKLPTNYLFSNFPYASSAYKLNIEFVDPTSITSVEITHNNITVPNLPTDYTDFSLDLYHDVSQITTVSTYGDFYVDKLFLNVNGEKAYISILKLLPEDNQELGTIQITAVRGTEEVVLCDSFGTSTLNIQYPDGLDKLPVTFDSIRLAATPKSSKSTVEIRVNNIIKSEHHFCSDPSDKTLLEASISNEQKLSISVKVRSEAGNTKAYTGTITRGTADTNTEFQIEDEKYTYIDPSGNEKEVPFELKILTRTNSEGETEIVNITNADSLMKFSTIKASFRIVPASSTTKIYIQGEEYTNIPFEIDIKNEMSSLTRRLKLTVRSQKQQILRPDNTLAGDFETNIDLTSSGPERDKTIHELALKHFEKDDVISNLSNTTFDEDLRTYTFILKKSLCGESFRFSITLDGEYTKAYLSTTDHENVMKDEGNLYHPDKVWSIGNPIYIYVLSQSGGSDWFKYTVNTEFADERSEENGIENILFKHGEEEVELHFNEGILEYPNFSFPYSVKTLTVEITLKDATETLVNASNFIFAEVNGDVKVVVTLQLSEGENVFYIQARSEKEIAGSLYQFRFTRLEGNQENDITSLTINGIDCSSQDQVGTHYDKAFSKENLSFSYYMQRGTNDVLFEITTSADSIFTISNATRGNSFRVEDGTYQEFHIQVQSEKEIVDGALGKEYTIRVYVADQENKLDDLKIYTDETKATEVLDQKDKHFIFNKNNSIQTKFDIKFKTKKGYFLPVKADFNGKVSLNQNELDFSSPYGVEFSTGRNSLKFEVLSELACLADGDENITAKPQNYTLTVERAYGKTIAELAELSIQIDGTEVKFTNNGTEIEFQEEIAGPYTAEYVSKDANELTITAIPKDADATIQEDLTQAINLTGDNFKQEFTITVLAEDGVTDKVYRIVLWRTRADASEDNDIDDFTAHLDSAPSLDILNPKFNKETSRYEIEVPYNDEVSVFIKKDEHAVLYVYDGTSAVPEEGQNGRYRIPHQDTNTEKTYIIYAVSEVGIKGKEYSVTVKKNPDMDATLKELLVDGNAVDGFTPGMEGASFTYLAGDLDSVTITATPNNAKASITNLNNPYTLHVGDNEIEIIVLAEDETTTQTYTIVVVKDAPAVLDGLEASAEEGINLLTPSFEPNTFTGYAVQIKYANQYVIFTCRTEYNTCKVIDSKGIEYVSDTEEIKVENIEVGTSQYRIEVSTRSGVKQYYDVEITKEAASTDASLSEFFINGEAVSGFTSGMTGGEFEVFIKDADTVTLSGTLTDVNASITTNPCETPTDAVVGENTFVFITTAEDGITTCEYTVKAIKDAPKTLDDLSLKLDSEEKILHFDSKNFKYSIFLEYGQNSLVLAFRRTNEALTTLQVLGPDGKEIEATGDEYILDDIQAGISTYKIRITAVSGDYQDYDLEITGEKGSDINTIQSFEYYKVPGDNLTTLEINADETTYSYVVDRSSTTFDPNITLTDEKSSLTMPTDRGLIAGIGNEKEVIVTSQTELIRTYKFIVYPCDTEFAIRDIFVKDVDTEDNLLSVDGTYIDYKNHILEIKVPSDTTSMKLDVEKQSEFSYVYVNQALLTDDTISLVSGENLFTIAVYSEYANANSEATEYISETVTLKITVVVDPVITITTDGLDSQEPIQETVVYGEDKSIYVAKQGYNILSVQIDGEAPAEIKDEYWFENVRENHTIHIVYEKITYTITVRVTGNGGAYVNEQKVEAEITFLYGETIKFKFVPEEGYKLTEIKVDNRKVNITNELNIGTIDDHVLELTFEIIKYKITYEIEGDGEISPNINEIEYNQTVTYVFTPSIGKKIKEVIVDTVSKGAIDSFTLTNVKEEHTIRVIFEDQKFWVTLDKQGLGEIDPATNVEYVYGATPTYRFTPEEGYHVGSILVNGVALGEEELASAIENGYTFEGITEEITLTVVFEINQYKIEVQNAENGTISAPQESYTHGDTASFSIEPNEGFHILEIKIDGISIDLSGYSEAELKQGITYTISNITKDYTIEVLFDGDNTTYKIYHRFQKLGETGYGEKEFVEEKTAKVNEEITVKPQVIPGFEAEPVLPFHCLPNGESELVISYYRLKFEISYEENPGIKSVTGFGSFEYEADVEIFVELNFGYHFSGFKSSNEALIGSSTTNPYSFKVPAGNVKFNVDLIRYNTIQIKETKNGIMDIEPGIYEYQKGENLTIHFRPYEGYVLKSIIVDGVALPDYEDTLYTFENINTNHTFELVFEQITFTLTVTIHGTTATFEEEHAIPYGTKYVYTVVPIEGYDLGSIYVDGVYVSNGNTTFEFEEVKEDHNIEVNISQIVYTIGVTIKGEGRVSPAGDNLVTHGSDRVLTFIPETGYYIKDVKIDNRSYGSISTYTFTRVTFDHRVEVEFEQIMFRIHIQAPVNGRIDYDGSLELPYASNQELRFIPNEGYKIKDVFINDRSVGALDRYTFINLQEDQNVVVEFEEITYTIEVSINGKGSVTPDIVNIVGYHQDISFTFIPELGYKVSRLAIDGEVIDPAYEYAFEDVLSNHLINVEFDPILYTITIDSKGVGTFNSDLVTEVLYNANKDIIFTTDQGHRIKTLELDGTPVVGTNKISLREIKEDHTIVVEFEEIYFTITVTNVIGNGTVTPGDSIEVPYGDNKNYSFTPDDGYKIKEIKIDGKAIEIVNSYMFYNVTENHTVSVEFEKMLHTIHVICGAGGTTTLPEENILEHRSELMCRFTPDPGFRVQEVLVDGKSVGSMESYFFGNVSTDHTIEVVFEEILFGFTIYFGPEGTVTYPTEEGPVKPSDTVYVRSGTDFVLHIEAKEKYVPKIMINGEKVDSTNELKFNAVDKDYFIQVEFVEMIHLDISKEGNGTVPESTSYEWRTPVTLVFKPEVGHKVKEVLVDGKSVGSVEDYTFPTLVVDHTVKVIFEPIQYKVSYKLYGKGTVSGNVDLDTITYGESCEITITPEDGWQVSIVFVDGEEVKMKDGKVTVQNVKDDVELVVYISEIPVKAIPLWIFIVLGVIILILLILLIVVSIWNRKRKDRYRY